MALATDDHFSARLLREAAALVYVEDLGAPELQSDDAHHLSVVLRLRPGELVVASDGAGSYRGCRVAPAGGAAAVAAAGRSVGADGEPAKAAGGRRTRSTVIRLVPDTEVLAMRRAVPAITVGFSLAKADRTDWAVAKLAELGVDRIVPLVCARTVARTGGGGSAGAKKAARLRRIAREASMQARRVWLPVVDEPLPFDEALQALGGSAGRQQNLLQMTGGIALAEPGGAALSLVTPILLVGPEGGWSPEELAVGLPTVHLGNTILRVETAAVVAGTLLTGLRSGVVSPAGPTGRPPGVTFSYGE
jgi:16S rRNA (uracil1498-N3)-methyltransferase